LEDGRSSNSHLLNGLRLDRCLIDIFPVSYADVGFWKKVPKSLHQVDGVYEGLLQILALLAVWLHLVNENYLYTLERQMLS
jgi:hypothetical protein